MSQSGTSESPSGQNGDLGPTVAGSTDLTSPVMNTEWGLARAKSTRTIYASALVGVLVARMIDVLAAYIGDQRMTGDGRFFVIGIWFILLMAPVVFVLSRDTLKAQLKSDEIVETLASQLTYAARIADAEAVQRDAPLWSVVRHGRTQEPQLAGRQDRRGSRRHAGLCDRASWSRSICACS